MRPDIYFLLPPRSGLLDMAASLHNYPNTNQEATPPASGSPQASVTPPPPLQLPPRGGDSCLLLLIECQHPLQVPLTCTINSLFGPFSPESHLPFPVDPD